MHKSSTFDIENYFVRSYRIGVSMKQLLICIYLADMTKVALHRITNYLCIVKKYSLLTPTLIFACGLSWLIQQVNKTEKNTPYLSASKMDI